MVIREILDGLDKAIALSKGQAAKLTEMRTRILECCHREEEDQPETLKIECGSIPATRGQRRRKVA